MTIHLRHRDVHHDPIATVDTAREVLASYAADIHLVAVAVATSGRPPAGNERDRLDRLCGLLGPIGAIRRLDVLELQFAHALLFAALRHVPAPVQIARATDRHQRALERLWECLDG